MTETTTTYYLIESRDGLLIWHGEYEDEIEAYRAMLAEDHADDGLLAELVLCESVDGWSLHPPMASDWQIAYGEREGRVLESGEGEPTDADRRRAWERMIEDEGVTIRAADEAGLCIAVEYDEATGTINAPHLGTDTAEYVEDFVDDYRQLRAVTGEPLRGWSPYRLLAREYAEGNPTGRYLLTVEGELEMDGSTRALDGGQS